MVKENINCKKVAYAPRQTFDFGVWKITSKNFTVNFLLVYRPPLASTLNCFTDEFLVLLEDIIAQHQNIIILGDFNIHFNDDLDPDTIQFKDTMLALGLQQHVTESTHNLGNILDHVYSESLSNIQVLNVKCMDFISNHKTIIGHINLSREPVINTFKSTRMLHKMDMDKFFEEADLDSLLNNKNDTDLDALLENFEHNITNALDSVAPERIVKNRSK